MSVIDSVTVERHDLDPQVGKTIPYFEEVVGELEIDDNECVEATV